MICATLANKPADLICDISYSKAFEPCFLTFFHRSFGKDGGTNCPCHIKMWRYYYFFPYYLFEGSYHSFIVCDSTLEEYLISNPFVAYYFLQIIIDDRISEPTDKVFVSCTFLHK